MKNKKILKKIIITIAIIFIVIVGLIIYLVVKDLKEESILKQEVINFSNKSLEKDDFTINIKTNGDYAYVEEAIKKYYKNLSENVKAINSYLTNKQLTNILSIESLVNDRPDFTISHTTIKNTKSKLSKAIENINNLCNENTIKNLIDKDKLSDSDYYYDLYLQLMYTKKDLKELEKIRKDMEELSTKLNTYLDKMDQVLTFLQTNDQNIEYSDKLYFNSENLLTEYKRLISELDIIASSSKDNKSDDNSTTKNEI